ncbi:hypothetical protein [Clostridium perfringens]|uniref:Uncharacterized protein n=1 Tax=Clostridium perfringens TaxID=1502 RepID=A0A133MTU7_CLOPF|nr:hypothetical protein [Clostridium perfringens]KXA07444.1 hypothetical protein HMPREF3222_02697 [Clostridium perfringens]
MLKKVESLETIIDMVIDSAADGEDLEMLLHALEDKVDKVDRLITKLEEESL